MSRQAIPPERLRWQPAEDQLPPGDSSNDLSVLKGTLGQDDAIEALLYAIGSPGNKPHVFLRGERGRGRVRLLNKVFSELKPEIRSHRDFCFVHNFSSPDQPRLIIFPRGQARQFQRQMHRIAVFVRERLPAILANDPIRGRREARQEAAERETRVLLRPLEKKLDKSGLILTRSQTGPNARLQVAINIMGKAITLDEFQNMVVRKQATREDQERIEQLIQSFDEEINTASRHIRQIWQQAQNHIEQIETTETARLMAEMTTAVAKQFKVPGVDVFLREVIDDILAKRVSHDTSHLADPAVIYGVNAITSGSEEKLAPLVFASAVSPAGLIGTVDPSWRSGERAVASFLGIRAGSLIQADGGYLVIDAHDLAENPEVFQQLLRILRTDQVAISVHSGDLSLAAQSLRPQSIPVDVGVILIGDETAWNRLDELSPEFVQRFPLIADLPSSITRDQEGLERSCRYLTTLVRQEELLPLTRAALAAGMELSARLADEPERLTTHIWRLAEIVRQADYTARQEEADEISREHLETAYALTRQRGARIVASKARADAEAGLIQLRGHSHGRLNVLVPERHGNETFGRPVQLGIALTSADHPGVYLESQAGPLPTAGYMLPLLAEILQLEQLPRLRVNLTITPGISAGLVPSTLAGQMCLLLATLAGVTLRQDIAIIGGVDVRGSLQRVSHVNERIEGFHEIFRNLASSASPGVIIPAVDQDRLVLDKALIRTSAARQFNVHAATRLTDALERLTGKPSGAWRDGAFPEESVLGMARQRLTQTD